MTIPTPLRPDALYRRCDPQQFSFATTADLPDLNTIIGQERAVEAIRVGIGIPHEGFNLFALGPHGTGKYTAVHQFLAQKAPSQPTPDDWCYIYNFEHPHKPRALRLPAGRAVALSQDMKNLVEALINLIPATFTGEEYQAQKKAIEEMFKQKQAQALETLKQQALEHHISLVRTPAGFAFAPLKDGEIISPDDFLQLSPQEQETVEKEVEALQESLQDIIHQIPEWQREAQEKIKELNEQVAHFAIMPLFNELQQKFEDLPDVLAYLEAVQRDVVENVDNFLDSNDSPLATMMGIASSGPPKESAFTRYQVNVLVDHSHTEGAPVIYEDQPTYNNLIGRIEHLSQMGVLLTDFTLIKPGALHLANGGYLLLDVRQVLLQPFVWEALKHALRAHEISIESLGQMYSSISTVSLEPEPIPLNIKVILLGDRLLYYLLYQYDSDFAELFKIAADFEDEMERNEDNTLAYARLIAALARKENLRHFDRTAVARVIEHSARLANDATMLSTHMQSVSDLLREANFWAAENEHKTITAADVQQALDAQVYRASRIRERIRKSILDDLVLIDTAGSEIGQINGLSVYMLGNHAFGRPSRITARIRLGKGEVIDIERQVEMGGPIHSKGVMILSGLLGARYAKERPFSLSATLVFEQSYSGVEGDSASSAELYALLSALADAPIKQSLAVTGSINQHGRVQAIGGINEKIEGFFDLCQARGLTGEQGVLMPAANVKQLMLRQEVVEAVAAKQFHIYPLQTVNEGIEILTGIPAGEPDQDGNYPEDSINGRVITRLDTLAEKQRAFTTPLNGRNEEVAAHTAVRTGAHKRKDQHGNINERR